MKDDRSPAVPANAQAHRGAPGARGWRRADLSVAKYSALKHLALADEPLSLSEMAARLVCVRSNISQLVDRLEADGLVRPAQAGRSPSRTTVGCSFRISRPTWRASVMTCGRTWKPRGTQRRSGFLSAPTKNVNLRRLHAGDEHAAGQ